MLTIRRLTNADLNYVAEPPYFVPTGAPIVHDLDMELAGFDSNLLDFGTALSGEPDEGNAMDQHLAAAAFNLGDFQAQTYDPVNLDYSGFAPGFETQLGSNESGLGTDPSPGGGTPSPTPAPTPTPTPTPPAPPSPGPPQGGGVPVTPQPYPLPPKLPPFYPL